MIDEDLPVAGELTDEEIAVATVQEVLVLMKILKTQMNRLKNPVQKTLDKPYAHLSCVQQRRDQH